MLKTENFMGPGVFPLPQLFGYTYHPKEKKEKAKYLQTVYNRHSNSHKKRRLSC